jgi:hypothetical protein
VNQKQWVSEQIEHFQICVPAWRDLFKTSQTNITFIVRGSAMFMVARETAGENCCMFLSDAQPRN